VLYYCKPELVENIIMKKIFFILKIIVFSAYISFINIPQSIAQKDLWAIADSLTIRLAPSSFPSLPKNIAHYLEINGYTIPQCYCDTIPHNVIHGYFAYYGQKDWAVLASKNQVSTIFVFWSGSEKYPTKLHTASDIGYLQGIGNEKIGYSRVISTVGKDFILQHFEWYGGTKPPQINHEGINDAFIEKDSEIHYYCDKWIILTGSD
jgi:hypothetical protein